MVSKGSKGPVLLDSTAKTVIGTSVCLVPLEAAEILFPGYNRRGLLKLFRALNVPLFHDKSGERFNLYTLETVLFYLLRPRGPGLAAPASVFRYRGCHKRPEYGCTKVQVTLDDLQEMASPSLQQERLTTGLNAYAPPRPLPRGKVPQRNQQRRQPAAVLQEQGLGGAD